MKGKSKERFNEFIYGFAKAANLDLQEAREQWAAFSRNMSDKERGRLELNGQDEGFTEGGKFVKWCRENT